MGGVSAYFIDPQFYEMTVNCVNVWTNGTLREVAKSGIEFAFQVVKSQGTINVTIVYVVSEYGSAE